MSTKVSRTMTKLQIHRILTIIANVEFVEDGQSCLLLSKVILSAVLLLCNGSRGKHGVFRACCERHSEPTSVDLWYSINIPICTNSLSYTHTHTHIYYMYINTHTQLYIHTQIKCPEVLISVEQN